MQGNRSVQEYYKEFQKCRICCEINECVEATENIFLYGLRPEIQNILVDHSYSSLSQLFELACMAEKQLLGDDNVSKLHAPICQNEIQSLEEDTTPFLVPNILQIPIKRASSSTMRQTSRVQCRRCLG